MPLIKSYIWSSICDVRTWCHTTNDASHGYGQVVFVINNDLAEPAGQHACSVDRPRSICFPCHVQLARYLTILLQASIRNKLVHCCKHLSGTNCNIAS